MNKFVMIPHNNQFLMIKKLQEKISKSLISSGILCMPALPLAIECEELAEKPHITAVSLQEPVELKVNQDETGIPFIELSIHIAADGKTMTGILKLVQLFNKGVQADINAEISAQIPFIEQTKEIIINEFSDSNLKKISPFKLCNISIERTKNSTIWEILSEKWCKL